MTTIEMPALSAAEVQYYLQHVVGPRPICLASTIDRDGRVNLSPFSFYNLFSASPPILIFSPSRRVRDNTTKHTLENVQEVPEVVVHVVTPAMVHQVSLASCEYPKGVDEFEKSGFTKFPATRVRPPMVAESPVRMECRVNEIKPLGMNGGAGQLVIAEVLCVHLDPSLLDAQGKFIQQALPLAARLGADWYARISEENLFVVPKPHRETGIGVDALPAGIRTSPVLRGSHLAQLASLPRIPVLRQGLNAGSTAFAEAQMEERHRMAAHLLDQGKVEEAWQLLLADEKK